MPDNSNNQNNKLEIELLKKDMKSVEKICDKLEHTADKFQQLTVEISHLLIAHTNSIEENQKAIHEVAERIQTIYERDINEHEEIKKIITDHYINMLHKLDEGEKAYQKKLDVHMQHQEEYNTDMELRMRGVEKWRWITFGIISVIVFVSQGWDLVAAIFKK